MSVAAAAKQLDDWREAWLNPPDWMVRVPEVVPGYPDRILPREALDEDQRKQLKKRTLTNLYNERPAWLDNAHRALDDAVSDAYGWPRAIFAMMKFWSVCFGSIRSVRLSNSGGLQSCDRL